MEPIPTTVLFLELKLGRVKCNLNAILRHLAAAAGFADNEDEGVTRASITEALRDDHLVIRRDATAQCPEIARAVEEADAIQAFLHSSTTGMRIPEPAPARTGIASVNRWTSACPEARARCKLRNFLSAPALLEELVHPPRRPTRTRRTRTHPRGRSPSEHASVCLMPNLPVHAL